MAQRTALFRPWPFVEGMIYSCGVRGVGSTERASAILRMVRGWTSVRPLVPILHTVLWFSSALSANSLCERNLCSRAALTFSPSILTATSIVRLLEDQRELGVLFTLVFFAIAYYFELVRIPVFTVAS